MEGGDREEEGDEEGRETYEEGTERGGMKFKIAREMEKDGE